MAQEYLPAPSNVRLADLMKEHNISQPELAKEIGCSKSTISRFISGAKGTLTHEQVLKIARLFNVSTDFLLGETNIPDRKNYDIAELGLSVEAAKNLYTGRVNTEVVNLLLENARFAELTYRIAQYFDDTFASGIAAQNAMLTTLSTLLRTKVKTPEAAKAAKDISLRRKPVYQGDLDDIEMYFMAAVKEIKKSLLLSAVFRSETAQSGAKPQYLSKYRLKWNAIFFHIILPERACKRLSYVVNYGQKLFAFFLYFRYRYLHRINSLTFYPILFERKIAQKKPAGTAKMSLPIK